MADNFLENQYNEYLKQKVAKEQAKKKIWQKRLKAYQASLKEDTSDKNGSLVQKSRR